jgi:hypothetical protein
MGYAKGTNYSGHSLNVSILISAILICTIHTNGTMCGKHKTKFFIVFSQ